MEPQPPPQFNEKVTGRKVTRQAAWTCALSNLLLPGLGTMIAGHRVTGVVQLVVSQTGFALNLLWAILFVRDWIRQGSLPEDIMPHLGIGLIGVTLFILAWIWSLASSVQILQESRRDRPPVIGI